MKFPTLTEVIDRLRNDFQASNSDSNPFLRVGFLKSLLDAHGGRYYDIYRKIKNSIDEAFISTCSEYGLAQHANENGLSLRMATKAQGTIIATGVVGEIITSSTEFVNSSGDIFMSTATSAITTGNITIISITQSGGVATVTATNHNMASGFDVTIGGAVQSEYNGTFTIKVTSKDIFTYSVDGSTASPATGTIVCSADRAIIYVESELGGVVGNLPTNESLDFVLSSPNINSEAKVLHPGLTGGADNETIENFKTRNLNFVREPIAPFNKNSIIKVIKESIPTASRVFVNEITPSAGRVTIYFVEDSQVNILPSAATIAKAKAALESIRPAVVDANNVFVFAPTLVSVDFTFSGISPQTQTMRDAIIANLQYFFDNSIEGVNITELEYNNILINTVDTITGARLESYTLTTPSGDITITAGELGSLGNVTFP